MKEFSMKNEEKSLDILKIKIMKLLLKHNIPGLGIALISREKILWAGGIGKTNLSTGIDVTAATHFRLGSISKTFIALSIMKLQEAGKVTIYTQVKDIAPEINIDNPYDKSDPVRVVHLLEHTAGFRELHLNSIINLTDPHDITIAEEFKKNLITTKVQWRPGTIMSYSSIGYCIAGYLIEKLTGQLFDEYIKNTFFEPLGMLTSAYGLTAFNKSLIAQGYRGNKPCVVPYQFVYLRPASSLNSSPQEMAIFVQLMLNRGQTSSGQLLSRKSIEEIETVHSTYASAQGLTTGYGFANYWDVLYPITARGHDGRIHGFASTYRYMPEQGLGFVLLFNSMDSPEGRKNIIGLVYNYFTKNISKPVPPSLTVPPEQLSQHCGYYELIVPRRHVLSFLDKPLGSITVIRSKGNLLKKQLLKTPEVLIPVSPVLFRTETQTAASMIFGKNDAGIDVIASSADWSYYERTGYGKRYLHYGITFGLPMVSISSILCIVMYLLIPPDSISLTIVLCILAVLLSLFIIKKGMRFIKQKKRMV
jgi:CubicO group peptidase (beta-lactamase class C family)